MVEAWSYTRVTGEEARSVFSFHACAHPFSRGRDSARPVVRPWHLILLLGFIPSKGRKFRIAFPEWPRIRPYPWQEMNAKALKEEGWGAHVTKKERMKREREKLVVSRLSLENSLPPPPRQFRLDARRLFGRWWKRDSIERKTVTGMGANKISRYNNIGAHRLAPALRGDLINHATGSQPIQSLRVRLQRFARRIEGCPMDRLFIFPNPFPSSPPPVELCQEFMLRCSN